MKLFVNKDGGGWIVDKIREDYCQHSRHDVVGKSRAQGAWCLSMWNAQQMWEQTKLPFVATIHHINPPQKSMYVPIFNLINHRAKAVIVPNIHTERQIVSHIKVPVHRIPYWLLSSRMEPADKKAVEKRRGELSEGGAYTLVGSFQKDSDTGTARPKHVKNPELFLAVVKELCDRGHKIKVILTGRARGYLLKYFDSMKIPHAIFPESSDAAINELYDCLDWYFITSRYEGGPQAVFECAYRGVKILSTDCGIASGALHSLCICRQQKDFVEKFEAGLDYTARNRQIVENNYTVEQMIPRYDALFERIFK